MGVVKIASISLELLDATYEALVSSDEPQEGEGTRLYLGFCKPHQRWDGRKGWLFIVFAFFPV